MSSYDDWGNSESNTDFKMSYTTENGYVTYPSNSVPKKKSQKKDPKKIFLERLLKG